MSNIESIAIIESFNGNSRRNGNGKNRTEENGADFAQILTKSNTHKARNSEDSSKTVRKTDEQLKIKEPQYQREQDLGKSNLSTDQNDAGGEVVENEINIPIEDIGIVDDITSSAVQDGGEKLQEQAQFKQIAQAAESKPKQGDEIEEVVETTIINENTIVAVPAVVQEIYSEKPIFEPQYSDVESAVRITPTVILPTQNNEYGANQSDDKFNFLDKTSSSDTKNLLTASDKSSQETLVELDPKLSFNLNQQVKADKKNNELELNVEIEKTISQVKLNQIGAKNEPQKSIIESTVPISLTTENKTVLAGNQVNAALLLSKDNYQALNLNETELSLKPNMIEELQLSPTSAPTNLQPIFSADRRDSVATLSFLDKLESNPRLDEQMNVAIKYAANQDGKAIKVILHPAELGSVEIELKLDLLGKMQVTINVEKSDTLRLLAEGSNLLETALKEVVGVEDASLSFNLKSGDGESKHPDSDPERISVLESLTSEGDDVQNDLVSTRSAIENQQNHSLGAVNIKV